MSSTNIQIAVKVRPLIEREVKDKVEPQWRVRENSIVQIDSSQNFVGEPYSFDHIFDQNTENKEVYDSVVKPLVMSCLEGINSTIFAYGQTSSGKTHTMLGDKNVPGIIMFTVEDIFKHIEESTDKNFLLRCSYLEIYNEKINDLLDTKAKDLKIREYHDQVIHVPVKEEVIRESSELMTLMKKGMKTRKIGCTDMNERSSRSHTIFKLVIQSQNKDSEGSYTESSLSLVDLAGSERVGQMKMKGERQAEGVSINKSLTTLGLVIRKLSETENFINYRDSKLTRLLQHSLGGNSKTLIICTITVAAVEETKSTLEFAQRAKYVKNRPIINKKVTDKDQLKQYEYLCEDYKVQIEKLRVEKLEREKTINALEDKISNIKMFTCPGFPKSSKNSKIPQRRHTLGYYKPSLKCSSTDMDSEGSDESHEEDDSNFIKHETDVRLTITAEDDKENAFFDPDAVDNTSADRLTDPNTPSTPKTPSPLLRIQKDLLEESSNSLKTFTSDEHQLTDQYDEIKELKEITDSNFIKHETDVLPAIKSEDDKENVNFNPDAVDCTSPNRLTVPNMPRTPKTPSPLLRMQKGLLEDSYNTLKTFTSYEHQFREQCDEIKELKEITERLRDENIKLRQQNIIEGQVHIKVIERYKDIYDQLILLRSILEGKSVDETGRKYLHTIIEEDFEMVSDQTDPTANLEILDQLSVEVEENQKAQQNCLKLMEENKILRQTLDEKDILINTLTNDCTEQKHKHDALMEENKELKISISNDKAVKEAELEILTEKIKHLNEYREEMHKKLSELQNARDHDNIEDNKNQNNLLQAELKSLKLEYEEMKRLAEYDSLKIGQLESENQMLRNELDRETDLKKQVDILNDKIKILTEAENQLFDLRRVVQLESQTITALEKQISELKSKNNEIEDIQKVNNQMKKEREVLENELSLVKIRLSEKEGEIKDLEASADKWQKYVEELTSMKEKCDSLELQQLDMKKKVEDLTQIELEYLTINKYIKDVFGESLENSSVVDTLGALKNDNDDLRNKLENSEKRIVELNDEFGKLNEELNDNKTLATENQFLRDKIRDIENNNLCLQERYDECLVRINNLNDENNNMTRELAEYATVKENLEISLNELRDLKQSLSSQNREIGDLTDQVNTVRAQYENKVSELESKKQEIDALKSQITKYTEKISQYSVLQQEYKDLQSELEDVNFQLSGEQKEVERLCQQTEEKTLEINRLNQQISQLKEHISKSKSEELYDDVKEDKVEREVKYSALGDQCSSLNIEPIDLNEYSPMLIEKNENTNKLVTVNEGENELNLLKNQYCELRDKLSISEENCSDHEKQLEIYKEELQECKNQLNVMTAELDEKTTLYDEILTTYADKDEQLGGLEIEKNNLICQVDELTIKLDDVKRELEEKFLDIKKLEEERDDLQKGLENNVALQNTLDKYVEDFSILKSAQESLQAHLDDLKNQLKKKSEELDERTKYCNDVVQERDDKSIEIKTLIDENNNLKKQLEGWCEKQETHEILQAQLKDQLKSKSEELNELINRYDKVLQDYKDKDRKIEYLLEENNDLKKQVESWSQKQASHDSLQAQLGDLKDQLKTKSEEFNELIKRYDKVLQEYKDKDRKIEYLLEENNDLKKQVESWSQKQASHDSLQAQLGDLKDQLNTKSEELNKLIKRYDKALQENKDKDRKIEYLFEENNDLKKQVESWSRKQAPHDTLQAQLGDLKDQLKMKSEEFNELIERYDKVLQENKDKDRKIEYLFEENNDLKKQVESWSQKQASHDTLQAQLGDLKDQLKTKSEKLDELNKCYDTILREYDDQSTKIKSLIDENNDLNNQLNSWSRKHLFFDSLQKEKENFKLERDNLAKEIDGLCKELKTQLAVKQEEIEELQKSLKQKEEQVNKLEKDKTKVTAKMDIAMKDLIDMKQTLDKRSEELCHLKGKYNALEVQYFDSKDSSKSKIQELEKRLRNFQQSNNEIQNSDYASKVLSLEKEKADLISRLESDKLRINQIQDGTDDKLKFFNSFSLQNELEHERLAFEKHCSEGQIKILVLEKELRILKQYSSETSQLKKQLQIFSERVNILEDQVKSEKKKNESSTQKLRDSEVEISNLQVKINELVQYKKKMQDKFSEGILKEIHVPPRLSDEGRPLSPSELRKIKRQSLHDQRRGLVSDSSESLELIDQACPECQDLRIKFKRIIDKNKLILGEIENMKKESENLICENKNLSQRNKELESKFKEFEGLGRRRNNIMTCKNCEDLKTKLDTTEKQNKKLTSEINGLKKENEFLDKENEDMLKIIKEMEQSEADFHNQMQKFKNIPEIASVDHEFRLLQTKYNETISQKSELEKELLQNKKLISKYRNKIATLENSYFELKTKLDRQCNIRKTQPIMENKETQATCDIVEKYRKVKKLAQIRRQEGNYLRERLNLPPDCAVLPEDLQRQPTNL